MNGYRWFTKKVSIDARKSNSLSREKRDVGRKHSQSRYQLNGLFTCKPYRHCVNEHEERGYAETRSCN